MNEYSNAADVKAENITQDTYNDLADLLFNIFSRSNSLKKEKDKATA